MTPLAPATTLRSRPHAVRLACVQVVQWLMRADGRATTREQLQVVDLARFLDVDPAGLAAVPSWNESWPALLSDDGMTVLMQAALLVTADDSEDPGELACLEQLQVAFGLPAEAVEQVLAWARDGQAWLARGKALRRA